MLHPPPVSWSPGNREPRSLCTAPSFTPKFYMKKFDDVSDGLFCDEPRQDGLYSYPNTVRPSFRLTGHFANPSPKRERPEHVGRVPLGSADRWGCLPLERDMVTRVRLCP